MENLNDVVSLRGGQAVVRGSRWGWSGMVSECTVLFPQPCGMSYAPACVNITPSTAHRLDQGPHGPPIV